MLELYRQYHIDNIELYVEITNSDTEAKKNLIKTAIGVIGVDNLNSWAQDLGLLSYSDFVIDRRNDTIDSIL